MTQKCKTTKGAQNITKIARGTTDKIFLIFVRPYFQDAEFSNTCCASERTEYLNVFRVNLSCSTAFYRFPHLTTFYFGPKIHRGVQQAETASPVFPAFDQIMQDVWKVHMLHTYCCWKRRKRKSLLKRPLFFLVDKWCRWPAGETQSVVGSVVILFKCFFLTQTIVIGSSIPPPGTLI